MWSRKRRSEPKESPFPGVERALDGHGAVYAVETTAGDVLLIHATPEMSEMMGPSRDLRPLDNEKPGPVARARIREVNPARPAAGLIAGYALGGFRTCLVTTRLNESPEALYATAGKRLPCVIQLTCRALSRQAGSLHGGHDDYYAAAPAGFFQLFAQNVQQAADFAVIAHRIAERSLTPAICAQDLYQTSHSVQNVRVPGYDLVQAYLGQAGDRIASPTPAQAMLFGERRRRIPLLVDRDNPAGVGGAQDRDSYFKAIAAQRVFFSEHLDRTIEEAMDEYGLLTGRCYHPLSAYRADDADAVVIAQGALVESLEAVVDYLRSDAKMKVGVIGVNVYRPFPGAALSRMLRGKKAVTVLERTEQALAEDLPLAAEVRGAIERAVENASADVAPYPSYESYRRPGDRPRVLGGTCGLGDEAPSFSELVSVFENMRPGGAGRNRFYLCSGPGAMTRDLPHLQTLQQKLHREYPGVQFLSLPAPAKVPAPRHAGKSVRLYSLSVQGGLFAGNMFSQALGSALKWRVRTSPSGGLAPDLQPVRFSLWHSDADTPLKPGPEEVDTILVSGDRLLDLMPAEAIKDGGTLVVETNRSPDSLGVNLSRRCADWIRDKRLRTYAVDARRVASGAASRPSFVDQLAVWALMGAYLKTLLGLPGSDVDRVVEHLQMRLKSLFGEGHFLIDDVAKAIRGGEQAVALDPSFAEGRAGKETDAPWTVRETEVGDGTVFDVARFWRSVGYLYDSGQAGRALVDPYVATGIIPARSSAYRDLAPYRMGIPRLRAEACTGCGSCWAHCPDSALPATVQSVATIIDTAVAECEGSGQAMIQLRRVGGQLAKQAYRLVADDDLRRHVSLGPLLEEAFSRLVGRMELPADKLEALSAEFRRVRSAVEHFPVIRTETFFERPHKTEKGTGAVLSIAINPLSCKGCRLCVEVCPEDAFEWTEGATEQLEPYRDNWRFLMRLPDAPRERVLEHISPDEPQTEVYRLLDKGAYHSLVGGDGAFPGNGVKTAVHLVTSTVESVMRPRFKGHIDRLQHLIEGIEKKIQGHVSGAARINDFEAFGRRLRRLGRADPESLADILGGEGDEIDSDQLKRLSDVLSRLVEQRRLYQEGAAGAGRARMVLTIDAAAASPWSGTFPSNPHAHPWACHLPGDAPALAQGMFEAVAHRVAREAALCRRAELELDDSWSQTDEAFLERFGWHDMTAEERELMPVVLVLAHAGTTRFEDISELLSRPDPVAIAVIDTDGLPVHQGPSPSGSAGANRHGSGEAAIGERALAYRDAFVMQGSVGHPGHLIRGVSEGIAGRRAALFHIYAPDPQRHGIAPERSAEQAALAYQSRAFPLFVRDSKERPVALDGNPQAEQDWSTVERTGDGPSGSASMRTVPLTVADWAVREARFESHFDIMSTGRRNDAMMPLAEYIEIESEQREGRQPYIDVFDREGRHRLAVVSAGMVRVVEERRDAWRRLRRLAAPAPAAGAEPGVPRPAAAVPEPAPARQSSHDKLTERLLWLCGYGRDPEFFKRSLREFVMQKASNGDGEQEGDDQEDISPRSSPGES